MSEDRDKHDRSGDKSVGKIKTGKPTAERTRGMGQHIPENIRDQVEGKGKGEK